jgi:hypothetical protein
MKAAKLTVMVKFVSIALFAAGQSQQGITRNLIYVMRLTNYTVY